MYIRHSFGQRSSANGLRSTGARKERKISLVMLFVNYWTGFASNGQGMGAFRRCVPSILVYWSPTQQSAAAAAGLSTVCPRSEMLKSRPWPNSSSIAQKRRRQSLTLL